MRTTVIFDNFGPYHLARLRACSSICALTAVQVLGQSAEYAWENQSRAEGFDLVTLFPDSMSHEASAREVGRRLRAALNESRPEVVFVPGWSTSAALAALGWCLRHRVPAVVMSESTAWDERRRVWKESIKRRIVNLCSAALVGGRPHAEYVAQLGMPLDRVFYGYDAVDNDYFRQRADEVRKQGRAIKINNGLPENYFLASARFIEKKNLPRLLQAYARYRTLFGREAAEKPDGDASSPWSLVLLGDGALRASLSSQIAGLLLQDHVLLPGFKQYRDLPSYYAFAGAFIHASTTEQWGLVVNEAMASGLPVLVSNRCGCAMDLVKNGRNGFTFDPLNEEELAKLMLKISAHDFPRSAFGIASSEIISNWGTAAYRKGFLAAASSAMLHTKKEARIASLLMLGIAPFVLDLPHKKHLPAAADKAHQNHLLIFRIKGRNIMAMPAHLPEMHYFGVGRFLGHTRKRQAYQTMLSIVITAGLQRIFSSSVPVTSFAELNYEQWMIMLREKLGKRNVNAILVWPRQVNRERIYLHMFDELHRLCAFVKVSKKIKDQSLLAADFDALVQLGSLPFRQIRLPRPLALGLFEASPFSICEPLPANAFAPSWGPEKDVSPLLREICPERKRLQAGEIMQLSWWKYYTTNQPPGSELFHQELLAQMARGAEVGRVHGDFSIANMAIDKDHVWLFDWETTHSEGPILTDEVGYFLSFAVGKVFHQPDYHVKRFTDKFLLDGDPQRRLNVMLALAYRHSGGLPDAEIYMRRCSWDKLDRPGKSTIKSYRRHFETEGNADRYETEEYASGSYSRLLWELEKTALDSLVGEFRQSHPHISYLDFASGTGRLAAYLEDQVDVATSIEISESMANVARQKLRRTQVLCKDITLSDTLVEGRYDLITAFRFFLNAEPALQHAAIKALATRLKDETSWLVLNNHGNLWSSKILAWPVHRLRNVGNGRQPYGNYLRHGEIKRLLEDAGLRIIHVVGLGALGGTLCRPLDFDTALRLEQWCAANSLINRFGQDVIYVVCRGSGQGSPEAD